VNFSVTTSYSVVGMYVRFGEHLEDGVTMFFRNISVHVPESVLS
jgi:hypothetical protein